MLQNVRPETQAALDNPTLVSALVGLALMLVAVGLILKKRVAPE